MPLLLCSSHTCDVPAPLLLRWPCAAGLNSKEGAAALRSAYAIDSLAVGEGIGRFVSRWLPSAYEEIVADIWPILQPAIASESVKLLPATLGGMPAATPPAPTSETPPEGKPQASGAPVASAPAGGLYASAAVVAVPRALHNQSVINALHCPTTFMPLPPAAVKGMMTILRPRAYHLSPAVGLALCAGGASLLTRLYALKPAEGTRAAAAAESAGGDGVADGCGGSGGSTDGCGGSGGSYCSALCHELFHRNHLEEALRPTTNLSLCAAHLSASLVAHIIGLVWTRAEPATVADALRRVICSETGLRIGERARGTVPSLSRFVALVALVGAADAEACAPLPYTGTALVLHHLWLRSPSRRELWIYLSALHAEYGPVLLDGAESLWRGAAPFDEADLHSPEALLAAATSLFAAGGGQQHEAGGGQQHEAGGGHEAPARASEAAQAFEMLAACTALGGSRSGMPLMMGKFGLGDDPAKADCTEMCVREVLNTLLWCPTLRAFDRARLPASSCADLLGFYAPGGPADQQQHAAHRASEPLSVPHLFYQMLCNLPGVDYLAGEPGRRYEASPTLKNVAVLLSSLMGLRGVTCIEDLDAFCRAARYGVRLHANARRDRLYVSEATPTGVAAAADTSDDAASEGESHEAARSTRGGSGGCGGGGGGAGDASAGSASAGDASAGSASAGGASAGGASAGGASAGGASAGGASLPIVEFVFSPPPDGMNHAFAIHRVVAAPGLAAVAKIALKHWDRAWGQATAVPSAALLPALLQPIVTPDVRSVTPGVPAPGRGAAGGYSGARVPSTAPCSPASKSEWLRFWLGADERG